MNVTHKYCKPSVASSPPFFDWSYSIVHCHSTIWEHVSLSLTQFSKWISTLIWWSSGTVCGDSVRVVNWVVSHWPCHSFMLQCFPCFKYSIWNVRVCADEFREEFLLSFHNCLIDFRISLSAFQMDLVGKWSWTFRQILGVWRRGERGVLVEGAPLDRLSQKLKKEKKNKKKIQAHQRRTKKSTGPPPLP